MTADLLADYLRRIRAAPHIGALAALEKELARQHGLDQATPRLLGMIALKWKRLEQRN